jgi:ankyrin repeat protein
MELDPIIQKLTKDKVTEAILTAFGKKLDQLYNTLDKISDAKTVYDKQKYSDKITAEKKYFSDVLNAFHQKININFITKNDGVTFLHIFAIQNNSQGIINFDRTIKDRTILSNYLDSRAGSKKRTPLMLAIMFNSEYAAARQLMSMGAKLNEKDIDDITALQFAARFGSRDLVKELIQQGADINAQDKINNPPHAFAIGVDRYDIVYDLLMSRKLDVNITDVKKNTPLHYVTMLPENLQLSLTKSLIDRGANVNSKDISGKTPLSYVRNADIVKLMKSKGAK